MCSRIFWIVSGLVIRRRPHHIKDSFERFAVATLSPGEWGNKFLSSHSFCSNFVFFVILFALNFLRECLVILWHNEFPNLCIGSEDTMIPNEVVTRSRHQRCKLAQKI